MNHSETVHGVMQFADYTKIEMKAIVPIQSICDLITNSSSEVFMLKTEPKHSSNRFEQPLQITLETIVHHDNENWDQFSYWFWENIKEDDPLIGFEDWDYEDQVEYLKKYLEENPKVKAKVDKYIGLWLYELPDDIFTSYEEFKDACDAIIKSDDCLEWDGHAGEGSKMKDDDGNLIFTL